MVMKMNKTKFIQTISEKTGYSIEDSTRINDVIERNFIISKKSKDKIVEDLIKEFNISNEESERIYEICTEIMVTAIKDKLKHPFRSN
jgi:nucleoid DNA-binding protein